MKWGSRVEMGRHVPWLGMSQQHVTLSRTPGMFGECQILNHELLERDKVRGKLICLSGKGQNSLFQGK